MHKREVTYEDFDGNKVTETFYFNLTKTEIVELEVDYEGGLEATLRRIIDTKDHRGLVREFKRLVLMAYGERSLDGKRFEKSDKIREDFSNTAAFDAIFMQLATDDGAAADFIIGIVPKELATELAKLGPQTPPLPPSPPTA